MNKAQTISRIVVNEVYANCSQLIEHLMSQGLSYYNSCDFVELHFELLETNDFFEAPDGYEIWEVIDCGFVYEFCGEQTGGFSSKQDAIQAAWEDSGEEPPKKEALEFWIVSKWLFDKLASIEAPVSEVQGLYVWGRTESGQCLSTDSHLNEVAEMLAD